MKKFKYFILVIFITINIFTTCAFKLNSFKNSINDVNSKQDDSSKGFTPAPNQKGSKPTTGLLGKCDPCPTGIKCVPHIQCPAHVTMKLVEKPQICDLPGGKSHGLCCTTGQNHTKLYPLHHLRSSNDYTSTPKFMNSVVEEARTEFANLLHEEQTMSKDQIERGQPEFTHNMVFRSPKLDYMKTITLGHRAIEEVLASRIYKKKEHVPIEEFQFDQLSAGFEGTPLEHSCSKRVQCHNKHKKYRNDDGTCNNPENSLWGSAGNPMERLLSPAYEDGIWAPRLTSVDGSHLASPRLISKNLFEDVDRPHPHYNLLVMQIGQFISHDVTQSASITLGDGKGIRCCSEDGSSIIPIHMQHYACLPIPVPEDDHFYRTFNQGCINFVRSSLAPRDGCKMGYGKQLSKVTHFMDGSPIYGSNSKTSSELRSFKKGKLRMFNDFGRDLLPLATEKDACLTMEKGSACFFAGDGRINQIITLTSLQTLFAREHNRVADVLSHLNPHWSDELLYSETRRIVVAQYQNIIYKEWLPLVIGTETMERFGLSIHEEGYSNDYDPYVNPSITNEFTAAAFRFGHSIVDGKFHVHRDHKIDEIIDIPEVMFNPARLRQRHFFDEILKTLTHQSMQKVDSSITKGLSRYLFRAGNPFGLDLASINIQRCRDQGCRPYNDYLEVSGNKRVKDFFEFGHETGMKLASVYKYPDDVDLWVGGLLETAIDDALVGPTFAEIIADQFSRFRKGDRYFFEHSPEHNPGHFSLEQLNEIRKVTMARLICDNSDHISLFSVQPNAFWVPDHGNEPVNCEHGGLSSVNLMLWKE